MTGAFDGERLLAGVAGRWLCREVTTVVGFGEVLMPWTFHRHSGHPEPSPWQLLDEVEQLVETGNYLRFLQAADPCRLVRALESVTHDCTRPETNPEALVKRETELLVPVAEALAAATATQWWVLPCDRIDQHLVDTIPYGRYEHPPREDPSVALAAGIDEEAGAERRLRERDPVGFPPPPSVGHADWLAWSVPMTMWSTTRSVSGQPPLAALGLIWDWDSEGTGHTRHWTVEVDQGARIYEIDSVDAWTALVARYPRDVTYSRRSYWWPGSSWEGTWLLPDWAAVSADYDGVHLTVIGFLEATAAVVAVGDARTTLVYWQPDETYWLNDVINLSDAGVTWDNETWPDDDAGVVIGSDGSLTIEGPAERTWPSRP